MTHNFVEIIRSEESPVKQPNQNGFSIDQWRSDYFSIVFPHPSLSDIRLYEAGEWFNKRFTEVRDKLAEVKSEISEQSGNNSQQEDLVRFQVGAFNFHTSNLFNELFGSGEDADFQETRVTSISELSELGDRVEGIINGARYPIADALKSKLKISANIFQNDPQKLLSWLYSTINLGLLYDELENLWFKRVYSDWYVDTSSEEYDLIVPAEKTKEEFNVVNFRRWQSICTHPALELETLTEDERRFLLKQPKNYIELEDDGRKIRLRVSDSLNSSQVLPPQALIKRNLRQILVERVLKQEEIYLDESFADPLPKFACLTLQQLLEGWKFISNIATEIQELISKPAKTSSPINLLSYSPVFSRTNLVELMSRELKLESKQTSKIIELLTFNSVRHDLWDRSLIQIDKDNFTMMFGPLQVPNLLRYVPRWLRDGGLDIDKKGHLFEKLARHKLQKNNRLSNVEICQFPLKYGQVTFENGNEGDIDLVLRIGKTIVIGELKSSVFPSDNPYKLYKYERVLKEEAAEQAIRAVRYVKKHLKRFLEKISFSSLPAEEIKVLPLIVSNLSLATGQIIKDVPVLDLEILVRYLRESKFTPYSLILGEEGVKPLSEDINYYSSEQEAEKLIEEYLKNPPQIQVWRENLSWIREPVPHFNPNMKPAFRARVVMS